MTGGFGGANKQRIRLYYVRLESKKLTQREEEISTRSEFSPSLTAPARHFTISSLKVHYHTAITSMRLSSSVLHESYMRDFMRPMMYHAHIFGDVRHW